MTEPSDVNLAVFVATSAAILGMQLNDEALAAVRDAMRGLATQAALVLAYAREPDKA